MSEISAIDCRIGFIGAGKMASALAAGMLKAGVIESNRVSATDVSADALQAFSELTSAQIRESPVEVLQNSDVVIIAVKPQHLPRLLTDMQLGISDDLLVISIAAGVSLSTLETGLKSTGRLIRVMPNTPCLVGAGASGYSLGTKATAEDASLLEKLLSTVGVVKQVDESLLDAVTGLSGSGPAYVYQFIEALSDGGVRMGLPRQTATELAAQTVLGAAKMVLETSEHPGVLKDAVTSPGGTTIAGLHALENGKFRGTVMNAVQQATERSRELG
jgi:pyrroline-5-carboxylate reductase